MTCAGGRWRFRRGRCKIIGHPLRGRSTTMSQGHSQRRRTSALLFGILALVALPSFAGVSGLAGSSLNVVSVGDEFIGRGQEYHFSTGSDGSNGGFIGNVTDLDGDGQIDTASILVTDLVSTVSTTSRVWDLIFTTAALKKPLTPGSYSGVVEPRKAVNQPAMDIQAYGRGCGAEPTVSTFTIGEIRVQRNSTTKAWELVKLTATFKFRCAETDARPEDEVGLTG